MKTFEELVLKYLNYRFELNYSERTIINSKRSLKYFNQYLQELNIFSPLDVTKFTIEDYRSFLFRYRKKNDMPLTTQEQRKRLSHVKLFFSYLVKQDAMLYNPASELEMPRQSSVLPEFYLTKTEMAKVLKTPDLETVRGVRDRAILEVFCATGMRRTELTNLLTTDIHFEKEVVFIRQGKGQKDRVVPISKRGISWVQYYIEEARPVFLSKATDVLFLNRYGDSIHPDFLTKTVRDYLNQANIKKPGSCHLFRHTLATIMLEQGAEIMDIAQMLGHKRLETTQVYAKVVITKLKETYRKTHPLKQMKNNKDGIKAELAQRRKKKTNGK